jgi:hypothetical protein
MSRAAKIWIVLVTFVVVVIAIGIVIFANPPSTTPLNKPTNPDGGISGEITVPGTPASGLAPATFHVISV